MNASAKDPHGHRAGSPWQVPAAGWKQIAARTWRQTWIDNVGLIAAGVAFYSFLAFVPLLGLIVLAYGFFAEPETVISHVQAMTAFLPRDVALLVGQQLMAAVKTSGETRGLGILIALLVALYGGANGAGAIIIALNIAYQEKEKRSLLRFYGLAMVITIAAVIIALGAIALTAAIATLEQLLPEASAVAVAGGRIAAYAMLLLAAAGISATLYRFAPSRAEARWKWITPGSIFTATTWLLFTIAFGFYVTSISDYQATYGSLGAMIALLTWLYLSAYVFLIGAELNSEIEHQTAEDSTTGRPEPIGQRGAWAADNVATEADADSQLQKDQETPSIGAAGPGVPRTDAAKGEQG